MKKKYLYLSMVCLALLACDKEDNRIFEQTPDERIREALSGYSNLLTSRQDGWLLSLETGGGGGFNHWVNFTPDNRVTMLSDAEVQSDLFGNSATEMMESSYRLKSVTAPVLMFDTYSYIHMLADPAKSVNGGVNGKGLETDFEFNLGEFDQSRNMLPLKGRFHKMKAVLTPCKAEETQAIQAGGLKTILQDFETYVSRNFRYPVLDMDGNLVDLSLSGRSASIKYIDDEDEISSDENAAYLDTRGLQEGHISSLHLFTPLEYLGQSISDFIHEDGKLFALVNGNRVEIRENGKPALPFRFGMNLDYYQMKFDMDRLEGTVGEPFLTGIYQSCVDGLKDGGGRRLDYIRAELRRNRETGKEEMELYVRYLNSRNKAYVAIYIFQMTRNDDGTVTFYDRDQDGGNARSREPELRRLVDYFCGFEYSSYSTSSSTSWEENKANVTKVIPHTFRLDWVENKTDGLSASVGGFYPVEADHMAQWGVFCGIMY